MSMNACLHCPITLDIFQDPVVASDGHTYDRFAMIAWFAEHDTSPLTNMVLRNKQWQSNHFLRRLLDFIVLLLLVVEK